MKSKEEFKILLYPNLSMLLSPPLSIPIFAVEKYQKQKAAGSVSCTSDPMDSIRTPLP